jgi:hypothetical protein
LLPRSEFSFNIQFFTALTSYYEISAAEFLVCTLLDPVTAQERTYRFVGSNYSWTTIFSTLEKIQGAKWKVTYKPVSKAREEQKKARCLASHSDSLC